MQLTAAQLVDVFQQLKELVMQCTTDAVILQKQQIIDDAIAAAEALADSGARGEALEMQ